MTSAAGLRAVRCAVGQNDNNNDSSKGNSVSKRLFRSGLIVSTMTMVSRVMGLARDVVIANLLGAGGAADAFLMANKIPNFLRRLFAEGAFSQAFVPVIAEYEASGDKNAQKNVVYILVALGILIIMFVIGLFKIQMILLTQIF